MRTGVRVKSVGLCFLILLSCFVQTASAVPTGYLLPDSSYLDGAWQGSSFYDELIEGEYLRGRIDFAVYDGDNLLPGSEEEALVGDLGLPGRFVYAYQIINDYEASEKAVAYFAVYGDRQLPLDLYEPSIGCYDDGSGGKTATSWGLSGDKFDVVWEFTGGLIYKGDHSWFLVFGSDSAPVGGNYEIKSFESQKPPVPIPEPATIVLLGLGFALSTCWKKKKV